MGSSWFCKVLRPGLLLMTSTVLRCTGQVLNRMSLSEDWSDIFLMIGLWLCAVGGKCCFHHFILRVYTINITLSLVMFTLITWMRSHLSSFLLYKVSPLPHAPTFHTVLFGRSHYAQPTIREWEIILHLLEGEVAIISFIK